MKFDSLQCSQHCKQERIYLNDAFELIAWKMTKIGGRARLLCHRNRFKWLRFRYQQKAYSNFARRHAHTSAGRPLRVQKESKTLTRNEVLFCCFHFSFFRFLSVLPPPPRPLALTGRARGRKTRNFFAQTFMQIKLRNVNAECFHLHGGPRSQRRRHQSWNDVRSDRCKLQQ